MKKDLLIKYLNNSCTAKEFDEFVMWIEKEVHNKKIKNWGFDDWNSFEPDYKNKDHEKYSALLDRIHHEVNLKSLRENKVRAINNVVTWLSRVAAIMFLPLLGVMFYMFSNNNFQPEKYTDLTVDSLEIIAPIGSRTVVQLSDGTEVNLNYGSKIKYPRTFTGNTREITLVGEGYFDVTHNSDKPFIVKTERLNIKAVGTAFNVLAYSGDDVTETTLINGKVILEQNNVGGTAKTIGVMEPGQHISFNKKTGTVKCTKGNIEKYIAWKNGKLVFDNEPITGVAEKLSRMFNVNIEVADNAKKYSYTVTFINDPLFLILDLMTETTPVVYKIFPRNKLPDGTFSKQKIRIEKKH